MKDLHIDRSTLLKLLKENCKDAEGEYRSELENYKSEILDKLNRSHASTLSNLQKNLNAHVDRVEEFDPMLEKHDERHEQFRSWKWTDRDKPVNRAVEYKHAIELIELDNRDSFTLDPLEIKSLVQGDWDTTNGED